MDQLDPWAKVLEIIKDQTSPANYQTWFSKTVLESQTESQVTIGAPTSFIKEQLSTKYLPQLEQAVEAAWGQKKTIEITIIHRQIQENEEEAVFEAPVVISNSSFSGLNPKYTLENYMVGLSNNLAFAAVQAVVQNPGTSYNPLFIYGGTGVGKTHLMQGVGNSLLKKNPSLKIIYCSSEKFMNDFIQSIQTKRTGEFRTKYRACDLLLMDDIQFISGRDSTQEEFFHTFNELHTRNTQIILTSDRTPEEMQELESRLKSRFQGGLMVDIQMPDFDTRVAILRAKCQERKEYLPEDCLTVIAQTITTNARELEGKLIQILQLAKLTGESVNVDTVRKHLGKTAPGTHKIEHKQVLNQVNSYFSIKMADLIGPRRKKEFVTPRQLAMYLLYEECRLPYERIGQILGGRDHTTILHGVEKIREAVTRDREVQRVLIELKQALTV
ncbi:MAG: chromosomal replication initiator protein DnaA [Candidatus Daviesbacteria bacterium]|nr:chromosomal replication initiator protein DnaA [Candidatus Daviesbacteria bacterium]